MQHYQRPQEEKERSGRNIRDWRSLQSEQDLSSALSRFRKEKTAMVHQIYKYACLYKYI